MRRSFGIVFAATVAAGLLFGWSIACVNTVLIPMRSHLHLAPIGQGLVVSAVAAGAIVGCLAGAKLIDRLGSRSCLVVAGAVSTLGAVASAIAGDEISMILSRTAIGCGVGLMSVATPIFVSGRSEPRRRGVLLTTYQLTITVGVLIAFSIGWVLDADKSWRMIVGLNAVPAVLLGMFAALCGAYESAPAPARPLLPSTAPSEIVSTSHRNGERRAIAIVFAASLMNALTGVGLLMYYSTDIFAVASDAVPADRATFIVGAVNTVASAVALPLVATMKRRALLGIGLIGMVLSLVAVAGGLIAATATGGLFAVGGCVLYMVFFAISAGPLAWLLVAEVAPPRRKASITARAVALNWIANMVLVFAFPVFAGSPPGPNRIGYFCLLFAALSMFFLVFVRLVIPETSGLTLEAIQEALSQHRSATSAQLPAPHKPITGSPPG